MADLRGLDEIEREALPRRRGGGGWLAAGLLLVAGCAAGTLVYKERERLTGELASAREQRDQYKQHAADAEAAKAKAAELGEELKLAQAKVSALEASVAQKSTEGETNDRLIAELRSKLDVKDGEVDADADRIAVNLVDQILFKSGEAELSPRGIVVLDKVGAVLKGLTDKQLLIGGHTDDRPIHTERFPSNWELSAARAVNVVHHLVDVVGVDPHRIAAAAYSQFHPRAKQKAKNRRIEILLTPIVDVKSNKKVVAQLKKDAAAKQTPAVKTAKR